MKALPVVAGLAALGAALFAFTKTSHAAGAPKPKPAANPGGRPTLRLGSQGAAVKELQQRLNRWLNFGLVEDGNFGPETDAAVRKFQNSSADPKTAEPLKVDGVVGSKTWSILLLITG